VYQKVKGGVLTRFPGAQNCDTDQVSQRPGSAAKERLKLTAMACYITFMYDILIIVTAGVRYQIIRLPENTLPRTVAAVGRSDIKEP
jgi:hypothetical protein